MFLLKWIIRHMDLIALDHNDVITREHSPRYWPLWWESISHRWIPLVNGSNAELYICFLWCYLEGYLDGDVEQTVQWFNTLKPRQNGRHFPDDIFKCIFLNENVWISVRISLKCVPRDPINNIPLLVQTMACRRPGDKPLSEPMLVSLQTHICITRPQWVRTPLCSYGVTVMLKFIVILAHKSTNNSRRGCRTYQPAVVFRNVVRNTLAFKCQHVNQIWWINAIYYVRKCYYLPLSRDSLFQNALASNLKGGTKF